MVATANQPSTTSAPRRRGFGTLFVVDLWERFSFYGMAAILVLYLAAPVSGGGQGMSAQTATALFACYISLAFMAGLPGGWLADRVLGARRSVLLGGGLIVAGHVALSLPFDPSVYLGLFLVAAGTGLVKPAMAAMVGGTGGADDRDREAVFSLFYMSIQVSAVIAPVVTGFLAEEVAWHLGFAAAAAGMALGLVQFALGMRRFGDLGRHPAHPLPPAEIRRVLRKTAAVAVPAAVLLVAGVAGEVVPLQAVLAVFGLGTLVVPFWFLHTLRRRGAFEMPRARLRSFTLLMLAASTFWMIFAQSGSVLGLFAEHDTDRAIGGYEVPASWFQSVHPLFVLLIAPVFAWLWVRAGDRLTVPVKFAAGLAAGGLSFVLMALAAARAESGPVTPMWLLVVYLLFSCAEVAIAPVGLAFAASVAPPGYGSRFLALNGLFGAVGVVVGGQLYRLTTGIPLPAYFLLAGGIALLAAVLVTAGRHRLLSDLS